ncbi:MAG TPA: zf-HC2 domain-containing protein [Candidatus Binatia bacterium]|jgi:anti-sigma factor RsiW|nr:zf-HC2 domain-containing protein [Candidatus Binatia bacterium]
MNCETYQDLVAAHVDGMLTPAERQEVEDHLGACEQCQRLFAEERRFHSAFAARRLIVPVPAEVEQRLHRALVAERGPQRPVWQRVRGRFGASRLSSRIAVGLAAAGLLLVLLLPWLFPPASVPDLLPQAIDYYQAAIEGRLALEYATDDPHALETAFNDSGQLDFRTRVIDFRPAGYRPRGGTIGRIQDHPVALAVYEGDDDPIVCLRQGGRMRSLPPGAEPLNKDHYLYTRAGYTVLLSQFSDHFCVLISRMSRETFLRYLALLPVS